MPVTQDWHFWWFSKTIDPFHFTCKQMKIKTENKQKKNVYKSGLLEVEMCISQWSANTLPAAVRGLSSSETCFKN